MNVFLDTNVVVDYITGREPFFSDALDIITMCERGLITGVVSSLTVVNCLYIARKLFPGKDSLYEKLDWMLSLFQISAISEETLREVSLSKPYDVEDGVQYFSALAYGIDVIVTRDSKGFAAFSTPIFSPSDFLHQCGK